MANSVAERLSGSDIKWYRAKLMDEVVSDAWDSVQNADMAIAENPVPGKYLSEVLSEEERGLLLSVKNTIQTACEELESLATFLGHEEGV